MKKMVFFVLLFIGAFVMQLNAQNIQFRKVDTTVKIGKAGYKVRCSNKNVEKNEITIYPTGFDNTARDMLFSLNGKVDQTMVDDLNNDGFPDLILTYYTGAKNEAGLVFALLSEQNQRCVPVMFPDIRDDAKLKLGYNGNDSYWMMEGALFRRFPLVNEAMESTGLVRTIQYKMVPSGNGGYKFTTVRHYDKKITD